MLVLIFNLDKLYQLVHLLKLYNLYASLQKKAYKSGAKHVYVDWNDETLTRLKFDLAPEEAFAEFPSWKAHAREELAKEGAAFMSIYAENPDLLKV